ncbi:hypothetical protein B0H14DRAFT_3508039 [Mycena olivaceomarginata]|nr:hypothetical protein B0H14DRAFT_3508039 [Mycena olivaceomarginata]
MLADDALTLPLPPPAIFAVSGTLLRPPGTSYSCSTTSKEGGGAPPWPMCISDLHAAYTPLHYVLLFHRPESGWHSDLKLNEPNEDYPARLTQTPCVAYRFHQRNG